MKRVDLGEKFSIFVHVYFKAKKKYLNDDIYDGLTLLPVSLS